MKYLVILGDGMADEPIKELDNKTPLQVANIKNIDELVSKGELGLVHTIPKGMPPGSDTANLSVLGYNPMKYYTGRSPLEAVSMGIQMKEEDVSYRCNLVTLSDEGDYLDKRIVDHSADEISTAEARELIEAINSQLGTDIIQYYAGISYRHLLLWKDGSIKVELIPPHDILGKTIGKYLPKGDNSNKILQMMRQSYDILKEHPVNKNRVKMGLRPANSIWIWGEGSKPTLPSFGDKYNMKGAMISAVDLLKGIAIVAGMKSIDVENSTGNIHTDFEGEARAAVKALKEGCDFVYLHIEAPDECSHRGELRNKIKSIELIDEKIVKHIKEELDKWDEDYKILVLPDHPTPIALRTHTSNPVPYLIYTSNDEKNNEYCYNEEQAKETGNVHKKGYKLMDYFLDRVNS